MIAEKSMAHLTSRVFLQQVKRCSLLIFLICSGPAFTQICFLPASYYAAGTNPNSLASADFNEDGNPDIIATNANGHSLSLFTGTPSGIFNAGITINLDSNAYSVITNDFNLDGHADLSLLTNYQSWILLGQGNGSFSAPDTSGFSVPEHPWSQTSADFNKDGWPDIAISFMAGYLEVKYGTGNGTFNLDSTTAGLCTTPYKIINADFNSDGYNDLASVSNSNGVVYRILNNGHGNFGNVAGYSVTSDPRALCAEDMDGDGNYDLVVANYNTSGAVSVLTGNGQGNFSILNVWNIGYTYHSAVGTADFNMDGKPDVSIANRVTNSVSVLPNTGGGYLGAAVNFQVDSLPDDLIVGDFNQDGKPDIAVADETSNDIGVLLNCSPVSVETNKKEEGISVYPNPATDHAVINLHNSTDALLRVYDVKGCCILNKCISREFVFPVSDFDKGIYTLIVTFPGNIVRKKLVVSR